MPKNCRSNEKPSYPQRENQDVQLMRSPLFSKYFFSALRIRIQQEKKSTVTARNCLGSGSRIIRSGRILNCCTWSGIDLINKIWITVCKFFFQMVQFVFLVHIIFPRLSSKYLKRFRNNTAHQVRHIRSKKGIFQLWIETTAFKTKH